MKRYSIVGMEHRKSEDFVKDLQPGVPVTLVREPANQYDPNAIMVWIAGVHVGYVPKAQNKALAAFIDQVGEDHVLNQPMPFAADSETGEQTSVVKAIPAKFARSPNSKYPMVEV